MIFFQKRLVDLFMTFSQCFPLEFSEITDLAVRMDQPVQGGLHGNLSRTKCSISAVFFGCSLTPFLCTLLVQKFIIRAATLKDTIKKPKLPKQKLKTVLNSTQGIDRSQILKEVRKQTSTQTKP